ncbi:Arylsulfatase [Lachnellula cervina]|uniref:Arylsulfatase n=1 Tax=Lachnellula cervina TaxID=1316786 RepID=A0A7D8UU84_9HELO|nr:Arylsulfatase [Lachnellula cervina]
MPDSPPKRPNFLIILADDLGFSDVGCFGGEIRTPNIDRLAKDGTRFTDFHAAAACSPTRAMIMTGTDHHIAGLGNLIEWSRASAQAAGKGKVVSTAPQRGLYPLANGTRVVLKKKLGAPGYEGYLNEQVVALPEILKEGGYETFMAGKWHLGSTKTRGPASRGFDKSVGMLAGCCNHYAYRPPGSETDMPGFMTTSHIAVHLEDNEYMKSMPDNWYSSDYYAEKTVEYLKDRDMSKPFFSYLPFTAPHWPLQAPPELIKHYRGVYKDGPDALRQSRLNRMIELGLMDADTVPHPIVGDEEAEWADMSPETKAKSSRAMEAFAGMVESIDINVGKVLDELEKQGELDNTFIMFLSDNGAEGAAYEAYPMIRGPLLDHLDKYYDNSLENIGAANSFVWYGPRWAQASTAPSRLYKAYPTEGGVRVPCVVRYPGFQSGKTVDDFATVMDIAPTILEMAGLSHPAPQWQGREVVQMRGESMFPWGMIHDKDFVQGWELLGRGAIRRGDWKAVFIPKPKGTEKWQLYNLKEDPGEVNDLADDNSKLLTELLVLWDQYVMENGVIPLQPEMGEYVEALEGQMTEQGWMEYEFWQPGAILNPEVAITDPPRFPKVHRKPTVAAAFEAGALYT